jgi:hypothetical protein
MRVAGGSGACQRKLSEGLTSGPNCLKFKKSKVKYTVDLIPSKHLVQNPENFGKIHGDRF